MQSVMNIELVGIIADVIAAIGVVATLPYLAVQVRENRKAVEASIHQSAAISGAGIAELVATNAEVANLFRNGSNNLSPLDEDQLVRFHAMLVAGFRNFQNIYFQHKRGILDQLSWTPWERSIAWYFWKPGVQKWWTTRKDTFHPDFVELLEKSTPPKHSDRQF